MKLEEYRAKCEEILENAERYANAIHPYLSDYENRKIHGSMRFVSATIDEEGDICVLFEDRFRGEVFDDIGYTHDIGDFFTAESTDAEIASYIEQAEKRKLEREARNEKKKEDEKAAIEARERAELKRLSEKYQ
ncbi:hypothetical protein AVU32_gp045 [Vibrio phage ValKK3]|uniref:Uncharacterized protein n=1 Tax=Vibrio phage ValKK3 TaxID=1610855 RepID=A0A0D4DAL5_9CAUD|nr:hypothetical protein AVU32_gp045 [Vibrio phage ValKK3]AJT60886.1 hypothetical protein [Vibrio phage ValKK3]